MTTDVKQPMMPTSPPPPPPPPQPSLSLACSTATMTHTGEDKRSKLLEDICRGKTLKKTTTLVKNINHNGAVGGGGNSSSNNCDDINTNQQRTEIESKKNLLQTELSHTLKRRKPVAIVEPPKYEYPTASNVDKIDDEPTDNKHRLNENNMVVLSLSDKKPETPIKSSTIEKKSTIHLFAGKTPTTTTTTTTITAAPSSSPPPLPLSSPPTELPSTKVASGKASSPSPPPVAIAGLIEKFSDSNQPKKLNETRKLFLSHGKPNYSVPSTKANSFAHPKKLPILTKQNSIHEKRSIFEKQSASNGIEAPKSPANKKQSSPPLPPAISPHGRPQWNRLRSTSDQIDIDQSTRNNPPINHNGHIFEQKTIVSFSKEMNDSPNRHPDHIRTKKTVVTTHTRSHQVAVFDNIRFSINEQAQVTPKIKH